MDNLITLPSGAIWDNSLPINEQEQEAMEYASELMMSTPAVEFEQGVRPKTLCYSDATHKLTVVYKYKHPVSHPENFSIQAETVKMEAL